MIKKLEKYSPKICLYQNRGDLVEPSSFLYRDELIEQSEEGFLVDHSVRCKLKT